MQFYPILKTRSFISYHFVMQALMLSALVMSTSICVGQGFPNAQSDQSINNVQDTLSGDTTINKEGMFKTLFNGEPGRAALYSLVFPGGGQLYNRKYWKWPLAAAIDGSCVYWLVYTRSNYKDYQRKLEEGLSMTVKPTDINNTRALRNRFRKLSEYAWILMVGGHMIPVFDAYVDRHLMNFDVSPDLTAIPMTSSGSSMAYTGLKLTFYLDK
jgi:hypothetical protein